MHAIFLLNKLLQQKETQVEWSPRDTAVSFSDISRPGRCSSTVDDVFI